MTIMRVGVKTLLSKGLGQNTLGWLYICRKELTGMITEFPKLADQAKKMDFLFCHK